jgi:hypothetical protein
VDYLGWVGWIATQFLEFSAGFDDLPIVPTPLPPMITIPTPSATPTPSQTPTPAPTIVVRPRLQNPGFEGIRDNIIPGWRWWAYDNYSGVYDPDNSYDTPLFKQADDPTRFINGPTLQIDAAAFLRFKVHVFQVTSIPTNTRVRFQVSAGAYADNEGINLAAGIDPNGGPNCNNARWGEVSATSQADGVVRLLSPDVTVGFSGQATVCLLAEPLSPAVNNAAFFDDAQLIVISE